jgi:hypothetical protein
MKKLKESNLSLASSKQELSDKLATCSSELVAAQVRFMACVKFRLRHCSECCLQCHQGSSACLFPSYFFIFCCVRLTVQAAKTNLEGLRDKLTAQLAAATEAEAVQAKERGKAEVPFVEHGDQLYLLRLA